MQAILGEALAGQDANLAALPSRPKGAAALVRVALEPAAGDGACAVGRTARLLLPPDAAGGGLFRRGLAAAAP